MKIPNQDHAIEFRQLGKTDFDLLFIWLNNVHVASHWGGPITRANFDENYNQYLETAHLFAYIASLDGVDFAFVQAYRASQVGDGWWPEIRDPSVFGVDYLIGEAGFLGRGLGSSLLLQFVKFLREKFAVSRVISDPAPDHVVSIRCLEKVGFRSSGIIQTPDGPAQLMELDCL